MQLYDVPMVEKKIKSIAGLIEEVQIVLFSDKKHYLCTSLGGGSYLQPNLFKMVFNVSDILYIF